MDNGRTGNCPDVILNVDPMFIKDYVWICMGCHRKCKQRVKDFPRADFDGLCIWKSGILAVEDEQEVRA